jgi:predicted Rossmann fold flavoprotein
MPKQQKNHNKTAIVGGGAAGFFLAINLKEMCPDMGVTIFERGEKVLTKVRVSGGGRCNCTNSFEDVSDLSHVYPRGHKLMKRLFRNFDHRNAYEWFERHGVRLVTQEDNCVFPAAQDSQVIIDCFLYHCRRLGVEVKRKSAITSLDELSDFDYIALTTGGQPRLERLQWLADMGHEIVAPVPSLFTFSVNDADLRALMGTVVENAVAFIPGTKFRAAGPLLITHWGMSGPAILKLSSYAARHLAEAAYHAPLAINWTGMDEDGVRSNLVELFAQNPRKQLASLRPFNLPARLWEYIIHKAILAREPQALSAANDLTAIGKRHLNRLVATLTADPYTISSRAPFRDEFVTCGGVALTAVNPSTLESRHRPHLYFAGELLDIDGITGGFNFQAAWTTAFTVAQSIAASAKARDEAGTDV